MHPGYIAEGNDHRLFLGRQDPNLAEELSMHFLTRWVGSLATVAGESACKIESIMQCALRPEGGSL